MLFAIPGEIRHTQTRTHTHTYRKRHDSVSPLSHHIRSCGRKVNIPEEKITTRFGPTSRRKRSRRLGFDPTVLYDYYINNLLLEAMLIVLLWYTLEYPKPEAHNLLNVMVVDG